MAGIFKHFQSHNKYAILDELLVPGKVKVVFRPYYLNDEKINDWFVQEYGGLAEFTKVHSQEVASEIGGSVKSNAVLALVTELLAEIRVAGKKSSGSTETYAIPTLLRFNILRAYWRQTRKLLSLSEADATTLAKPHNLVLHQGSYLFGESVKDLTSSLTKEQAAEIKGQQEFEKKAENENHYLFLIKSPVLAVSICSGRFVTHVGHRYLRHYSSEASNTLFLGATIGFKHGILFLDPIAIGEDVV